MSQEDQDDMTDASSDQGTDTSVQPTPDAMVLPPENPAVARAERHPAAPAAVAAVAAAEVADATDNAALRHAVAANRGTNLDDLMQTILDRLDGQDSQTTERIDALVAAQVDAQAQIERLRRRRRDAQHRDDQEGLPSPRTPAAKRSENQRRRPASIIIGSDMSSKMHRATSSGPELEKVLEETQRSPFTTRISEVRVHHVNKVKLIPYNGLTDPKPFLKSLSIAINRAQFSAAERDAGSCQLLVEKLIDDALNWFSRLEANTIDSYHQLTSVFLQHHSIFMVKGTSNADLWTMSQKDKEPLRKFIERFKKVVSSIAITDDAAIAALRNACSYESRFREDLVITQPATLEDTLHRANRFIEVEEEKAAMAKRQPKASNSQPSKPWNKYYRETDPKRNQAYCEFHKVSGHSTDECRQLQQLLLSKFKKGDLDVDNGRNDRQRTEEPHNNDRRPESPKRNRDGPRHDDNVHVPRNRIHMIMGGLTTCRDSVRSIRNYGRQAKVHRNCITNSTPTLDNTEPITFTEADAAGQTGVDLRSAEHNVQPITGFDGDTVMTVGTIMLPIYVGGTKHFFNFAVVDKAIVYNVILGTPWLYKMKAVASTYMRQIPDRTWNLYVEGSIVETDSFEKARVKYVVIAEPAQQRNAQSIPPTESMIQVNIDTRDPIRCISIGSDLPIQDYCDSQLVANQFNGDYEAKNDQMDAYLKVVRDLSRNFELFELNKIPRSDNAPADALLYLHLPSAPPAPTIGPNVHPIIYSLNKLTASTCSAITQLLLPNNVSTNTPQADMTDSDWQTEIRNYIADGIVPADKWAARRLRARSTQYTLFDGNLCRWNAAGVLLSCISGDATLQVMREIHEGTGGNHSGASHSHHSCTNIALTNRNTSIPIHAVDNGHRRTLSCIPSKEFATSPFVPNHSRSIVKTKERTADHAEQPRVKPNEPWVAPNEPRVTPNEPLVTPNDRGSRRTKTGDAERPRVTPNEPRVTPNEPRVMLNDRGSRRTTAGHAERTAGHAERPRVTSNEPWVTPNKPRVTPNEPRVTPNDRGSRRTKTGHAERPRVTPNEPRVTPNEPRDTPNDRGSP
ncbi:Retrotransposon gag domain [Arabidopsis suecica]|uniref:Retrotransposon gag domain n=1 Tax=Arabidopsis suecica TaxID=45249 RepID=A0A8T1ZEV6_ARASU|nr:Retrotransposon gag domain [Arabidopsis suecica]